MSNLNNDLTQQHTALTNAYTDMNPGHRSEVAQAFIDRFRQCDDPGALDLARQVVHQRLGLGNDDNVGES